MTIGDRIRKRREELGMSQEDLAIALGYSGRSTINKIEMGKSDVKLNMVDDYAKALKTTHSYLMGWDDSPEEEPVPEISDSDLKFALFGTTEIDDDVLEDVKNFARFTQQQKKKSDK